MRHARILSITHRSVRLAAALLVLSLIGAPALAQPQKFRSATAAAPASQVATYKSRNFTVHTDLSAADAQQLLRNLETMLGIISRYWACPNRKMIECYVVEDLANWPAGAIPETGLESIRGGGGITLSQVRSNGKQFDTRAVVYATAAHGTPQHEAVHAYCALNFGRTGPVWYSEGMAEMGKYWIDGEQGVNCRPGVIDYLRRSTVKPLNEIITTQAVTGDSWQNYAWRWALCHLLTNNPNYSNRFRPLGLSLLAGKRTSFDAVYGSMAPEIEFEYRFFLEHLETGYRVDLCAWDWTTRFRKPRGNAALVAQIEAARGWQPSRLEVTAGETYRFEIEGEWRIETDGEPLDADGDESGAGRLVGVLWNDYRLGEPFDLGRTERWTAPGDGRLMLRCRDSWSRLDDNSGKVTVRIRNAD